MLILRIFLIGEINKFAMLIDFYSQVYEIVCLVPFGRVTNYGAIAKVLGSGKSARLVGIAMNNSHSIVTLVPAHRIVIETECLQVSITLLAKN